MVYPRLVVHRDAQARVEEGFRSVSRDLGPRGGDYEGGGGPVEAEGGVELIPSEASIRGGGGVGAERVAVGEEPSHG